MKKKIVTLYIDDSSLRLMVMQGKRIKKWVESPLEPGLIKSNVVVDEAEVAARVKRLFKTQKERTKNVIIGLSGLHCLTRPMTLPALPKAMLGEAVTREAKRVLPVPLEQLYVTWQTIPSEEGRTQVFVVAIPCKTADSVLKMLRKAGLKSYLLDLKPLALTRLVKETTAIIIDVQPTEFDIVIMADGVPQPIRTVPLPGDPIPQKEKWSKLREELDRTIKFYNSNNPNRILGPDVPMYVSGELANRPRLDKSLSDEFGFPVKTLSSPWCGEELDPARCAINLGLACKEPSFLEGVGASVVNVNALPVPYRPKPIPLLKAVALPTAVAFIGATILLTTYIQDASARVASVRGQLESTNNLITQRQAQKKELTSVIADLEKRLSQSQARHGAFAAVLKGLEQHHERINGDLHLTTGNLPVTTILTGINQTVDKLTVQGRAPDEAEVLAYARSLEPSGRFSEITVASIRRVDGAGSMDFTLILTAKR